MTDHAIDREEVMAYVDGELRGVRLSEVEAHVSICAECRALVSDLREVSVRLSGWRVTDTTDGLAGVKAALSASLTSKPRPGSWLSRVLPSVPRWAIGGALAAIAGAIVMTPWLLSSRSKPIVMSAAIEAPTVESRPSNLSAHTFGEAIAPAGVRDRVAAPPSPPAPPPPPGGQGQGQRQVQIQSGGGGTVIARQAEARPGQPSDRMVIRTARMVLTSDRFDQIRADLERLMAAHQGRLTSLNTSGDPSSRRSLHATVGVPTARLDGLLTGLRALGRVQEESLGSDDVTDNFRDLTLRIANARREEQRLVELLTRRTGDLADVLAVEREIARVRLDIERMEAEKRTTEQRVDLATVTLTVHEQYRADLAIGPLPLDLRFKNALVDGFRQAAESLIAAALIALQTAPLFLAWGLILAFPVRWIWRRARAALIPT